MKVLVGYASRHGATAGIAERIADGYAPTGCPPRPVQSLRQVTWIGTTRS